MVPCVWGSVVIFTARTMFIPKFVWLRRLPIWADFLLFVHAGTVQSYDHYFILRTVHIKPYFTQDILQLNPNTLKYVLSYFIPSLLVYLPVP